LRRADADADSDPVDDSYANGDTDINRHADGNADRDSDGHSDRFADSGSNACYRSRSQPGLRRRRRFDRNLPE
jgi:hypothetical protein